MGVETAGEAGVRISEDSCNPSPSPLVITVTTAISKEKAEV